MITRGEGPLRGRIALHGGGEFEAGDEPFLDALVAAARPSGDVLRIAVVPVAAARERPTVSANHGIAALRRAAARAGVPAEAEAVLVVDRETADDPDLAARLAAADLIHLPGGNPDLVPATLEGTLAWRSILAAHGRGAVVAGASAGAMGLATRTWTPTGWRAGLGLVSGLIVVPHFGMFESNLEAWATTIDELDAAGFGRLGLDERTGIISTDDTEGPWQVAGQGRAHWYASGGGDRVIAAHGETLTLAGGTPPT